MYPGGLGPDSQLYIRGQMGAQRAAAYADKFQGGDNPANLQIGMSNQTGNFLDGLQNIVRINGGVAYCLVNGLVHRGLSALKRAEPGLRRTPGFKYLERLLGAARQDSSMVKFTRRSEAERTNIRAGLPANLPKAFKNYVKTARQSYKTPDQVAASVARIDRRWNYSNNFKSMIINEINALRNANPNISRPELLNRFLTDQAMFGRYQSLKEQGNQYAVPREYGRPYEGPPIRMYNVRESMRQGGFAPPRGRNNYPYLRQAGQEFNYGSMFGPVGGGSGVYHSANGGGGGGGQMVPEPNIPLANSQNNYNPAAAAMQGGGGVYMGNDNFQHPVGYPNLPPA